MQVLIFILVLIVLIVVHELGHFIAAKLSGMRVDEFGIGYPPRAATLATIGETEYTLNWIPFGGFVKIYGEDGGEHGSRAFTAQNRFKQAVVLVAGIAMNLLLAYVLITGALIAGTPRALDAGGAAHATNVQLTVADVLPGSPAAEVGLLPGDAIIVAVTKADAWRQADQESFTRFISQSNGNAINLSIIRNGAPQSLTVIPRQGIAASNPERYALGVEVFAVGVVPLSFQEGLVEGALLTWNATVLTAEGLARFFYNILTFRAELSQVSGPVGIAGAVGSASQEGFGSLLSIMAIISINLALINLIPIPALDGGRLLFVLIETIMRRPIKAHVAQTVNIVGFSFLILLMLVVTAHDIFKIVG